MLHHKILGAILGIVLSAIPALAQSPQFGAGQVFGNSTAAQRNGRPENVTAILDRAFGSTRGALLERGASGWAIVGPGATAGLAWISAGTGADPAYGILGLSGGGCNAVLTASNGGILYSTASACAILAGTATARLPLISGATAAPTWGAFSLPASVTSGGIPYFSSTSAQLSSALLTANAIMLGGGAGTAPVTLGSLGTTTTLLHGNAAGAPTFGAVALTTDVSGQLPIGNGGTGQATAAAAISALMPTPTRAGDLAYWNGSNWVTLAGNNSGTNILQENASGVPSWVAVGAGTLQTLTAGTGISFSSGATCTTTCTVNNTGVTSVSGAGMASGTVTTTGNITVTAASKSDQQAASSGVNGVTPLHQQDHDSAAKAWAVITPSTGAILASYNVSGVVRNSTGNYTATFTTSFASTSYACNSFATSVGAGFLSSGQSQAAATYTWTTVGSGFGASDASVNTGFHCFGRQ